MALEDYINEKPQPVNEGGLMSVALRRTSLITVAPYGIAALKLKQNNKAY